ncbi:uncharacterized protein LOC120300024 [Crotalus tigris]|uniref:uncharacterized protein LOC120300024 n=1 Tax=Crotalus tigris TaxID=88082 RepID=UPI00192F32E9|nr:uncharacterized protein LOC120300024 [Crotalus tigris]
MFGSDSFIFNDPSDRKAKLCTTEAKAVRTFGQEKRWNLKHPPAFPHFKKSQNHIRGERKQNTKKKVSANQTWVEKDQSFNPGEPLKSTKQETVETAKHESSGDSVQDSIVQSKDPPPQELQLPRIAQPQQVPSQAPSADMLQSWLMTPQLNSILAQRKHESIFKHDLEEGFLKRIARRKVRRHVFGEINTKKVYQFGTACTPFHALTTTEMETLTFPSNLPMTPRMMNRGIVCTNESELKTIQLTFPELDEESAKKSYPGDRKKPFGPTKKSTLPLLVKMSRSRFSENKKISGCHLPRVPTVPASISLKWGKF